MAKVGRSALSVIGAAIALTGCAGAPEGRIEPPDLCDIRSSSCQRVYAGFVAVLMDEPWFTPRVVVIRLDAYEAVLRRELAEMDLSSDHFGAALELVGLDYERSIDGETLIQDRLERVAGFYSVESKRLTVIDRGAPLDSKEAVGTLVHELVHALQDAVHDLAAVDAPYEDDGDGLLATRSVVEGEAEHYEALTAVYRRELSAGEVDWDGYYDGWQASSLERMDEAESIIDESYSALTYSFGGDYVTSAWLAGGTEAVEEVWAELPTSTASILSGWGAPPVEVRPVEADPGELPGLDAYQEAGTTVIGHFQLLCSLRRIETPERAATLAAAWRGDRVWAYRRQLSSGESSYGVIWLLHLDDSFSASAIADSLRSKVQGDVSAHGSDVLVTVTDDLADDEAFREAGAALLAANQG